MFFFLACSLSSFAWRDIEAKKIQYIDYKVSNYFDKNILVKTTTWLHGYLQFFCLDTSRSTKFLSNKEEQLSSVETLKKFAHTIIII